MTGLFVGFALILLIGIFVSAVGFYGLRKQKKHRLL